MNTHDIDIDLPEHDCIYEKTNESGFIDVEPAYRKSTVLRLIEADRKRRGEPWGWTVLGVTYPTNWTYVGDRAERRAKSEAKELGDGFVAAPLFLGSAPQPAEPDLAKCAECGAEMIHVRPGKWQHPDCPQSPRAAEPVLYTSQKALDLASRSDAVINVGLTRVPQMSWNVPLYTAPQPAEPVKKKDWNVELSSWSDEDFVQVFHECPDLADRLRRVLAEPVKVPNALPSGTNYSVEPHGNGYAIYQGRDGLHHGANLAHLTECTPEFSKRIESALNAMSEPVKVPSDSAIMFEWSQTPNTGDMRVDLVAFARALLARYGNTQQEQP